MKQNIKPCLEQHLPDKAKPGNAISAELWFTSAERHIASAKAIIDNDASGAFLLGWQAMHDTAKGLAALGNCRLENETHGKIVDFLVCVFDQLDDFDKGLVRRASSGRNALSYDDPENADVMVCNEVLRVASKLLAAARAGKQPPRSRRRIPPPPPKKA